MTTRCCAVVRQNTQSVIFHKMVRRAGPGETPSWTLPPQMATASGKVFPLLKAAPTIGVPAPASTSFRKRFPDEPKTLQNGWTHRADFGLACHTCLFRRHPGGACCLSAKAAPYRSALSSAEPRAGNPLIPSKVCGGRGQEVDLPLNGPCG